MSDDIVTNGEMIRAMCDQELANYITNAQIYACEVVMTAKMNIKLTEEQRKEMYDKVYPQLLEYMRQPYKG